MQDSVLQLQLPMCSLQQQSCFVLRGGLAAVGDDFCSPDSSCFPPGCSLGGSLCIHLSSHPLLGCTLLCSPAANAAREQLHRLLLMKRMETCSTSGCRLGGEPWPCSHALLVPSAARGTGHSSHSSCSDRKAADAGAASAGREEEGAGMCAASAPSPFPTAVIQYFE